MFSQTAEYALRAVVSLAQEGDRAMVTQQIADVTRVPAGYLSKVLRMLGRANLVQAQRGLHGGFTLARPSAEISVLDVINAVDPFKRITTCPLKLKAHGTCLCPLHRRLDGAIAQVQDALAQTNIAALLAEPTASSPLCRMPKPKSRRGK